MKTFKLCHLLLSIFVVSLAAKEDPIYRPDILRATSSPFISGDTFRAFCDHIYDETDSSLRPKNVKRGDKIFVRVEELKKFFAKVHPHIKEPYILITHNSDWPIPGAFSSYLDDPRLLAWFGTNVEGKKHRKLHPIPIGIANRCWRHGSTEALKAGMKNASKNRKHLCYMNHALHTCRKEREFVYNLLINKSYVFAPAPGNYTRYLQDLGSSIFVISPRGNGLDCHRTWEALYLGAFPVVRTSALDPLFEGLPVVILKDWTEINEDFLNRKYKVMRSKDYQYSKLYFPYWQKKIEAVQLAEAR